MDKQSFNKERYTGKNFVQQKKIQIKVKIILMIRVGNKKGNLSQINNQDLVLPIKNWTKKLSESKYLY